jgi:hypothetical protein
MLTYDKNGTNGRKFCTTCGVHMSCHKEQYKMFALFPSTIKKSNIPVKPVMHIMVKEKDPTIQLPEDCSN